MSTIQIRNVPDDVHRQLKVRAAQRGQSLSDYLLAEVLTFAQQPTLAEWTDAARDLGLRAEISAAEILAEDRRR